MLVMEHPWIRQVYSIIIIKLLCLQVLLYCVCYGLPLLSIFLGTKVAESVLPLLLSKGMTNPSTDVRAVR